MLADTRTRRRPGPRVGAVVEPPVVAGVAVIAVAGVLLGVVTTTAYATGGRRR